MPVPNSNRAHMGQRGADRGLTGDLRVQLGVGPIAPGAGVLAGAAAVVAGAALEITPVTNPRLSPVRSTGSCLLPVRLHGTPRHVSLEARGDFRCASACHTGARQSTPGSSDMALTHLAEFQFPISSRGSYTMTERGGVCPTLSRAPRPVKPEVVRCRQHFALLSPAPGCG